VRRHQPRLAGNDRGGGLPTGMPARACSVATTTNTPAAISAIPHHLNRRANQEASSIVTAPPLHLLTDVAHVWLALLIKAHGFSRCPGPAPDRRSLRLIDTLHHEQRACEGHNSGNSCNSLGRVARCYAELQMSQPALQTLSRAASVVGGLLWACYGPAWRRSCLRRRCTGQTWECCLRASAYFNVARRCCVARASASVSVSFGR
jgi:hypothetical protein